MPLLIVRNDITKMDVDAIVNAANPSLLGGGGVDGAIHRAAGPGLLEECRTLGGCLTGQAKLTGGYDLPARHVIHTVGPIWQGGSHNERALLASCYRESLRIAAENGFESIAFPLISSGIFGYPKAEAFAVAEETCRAFLEDHGDMTVYLTVFGRASFAVGRERFEDIRAYIDDHYVEEQERRDARRRGTRILGISPGFLPAAAFPKPAEDVCAESAVSPELERALRDIDESFTQMLLRKIDERGMTDPQCYKKANMDRKHFSKIRSDLHYHPKKATALALAIALELPLDEMGELLRKAGYALSHSDPGDIVVEYHVVRGIYDIYQINDALLAFDLPTLGG